MTFLESAEKTPKNGNTTILSSGSCSVHTGDEFASCVFGGVSDSSLGSVDVALSLVWRLFCS